MFVYNITDLPAYILTAGLHCMYNYVRKGICVLNKLFQHSV